MTIMRKIVYLGCVFLLLVACERPFNILNSDEMSLVLADIHLAEATMGSKISYTDYNTKRAYYESIFEKHHLSRDEFDKSLDWYARHPKQFEEVYAKVLLLVIEKQEQVKNYVYHPEENPEFLNLIDSIDLWVRPSTFEITATNGDSIYFELNEPNFFRAGDNYVWYFVQHVAGSDTMPLSYLKLFVQYPNQLMDSISYCLPEKQATFRYKVTLKANDSVAPQRMFGWFYTASLDSVKRVTIDTVSLVRFFNKQQNPLDSSVVVRLNALRKLNGRESLNSQETNKIIPTEISKEQLIKQSPVKDNRLVDPRVR